MNTRTCLDPRDSICKRHEACHDCPNAENRAAADLLDNADPIEWIEETPTQLPWQDDYTPSTTAGALLAAINAKQLAQLEMEAAALAHHNNPTPATVLHLDHYAMQLGRAIARLHAHHLRSIARRS